MEEVFIVYKIDTWHSYASRDTIGVVTTIDIAITICKQHAKKSGKKIHKEELWNLANIKQTQGYRGEGEFHIEPVDVNVLL